MSTTKFITFGCWNKNGCSPTSGLANVMEMARAEPNVDFFLVNGDNYYPDKTDDGDKVVNRSELICGMDRLNQITDKEIFVLLGNHDIETIRADCETIALEKEFVDTANLAAGFEKMHLPMDLTMFKYLPEQNTMIIMIDSNIYAGENPTCYNEIIRQVELPHDDTDRIAYLQLKQTDLIEKAIRNKHYTNIVICAHHPLIGFKNQTLKSKHGRSKVKGGLDMYGVPLYELLYNTIRNHSDNVFYICADIHNYQNGIVRIDDMEIRQIIAGTGGADLDPDYNEQYDAAFDGTGQLLSDKKVMGAEIQIPNSFTIQYALDEHSSAHGFIIAEIVDSKISFRFKSVLARSGGKRKTIAPSRSTVRRKQNRSNTSSRSKSRSKSKKSRSKSKKTRSYLGKITGRPELPSLSS
jgi:hypothetical protein